MCELASFMVPRSGPALWSKLSDSHEKIIEEHGLHVDGCRGANCVAAEITPPDRDFTLPLEQWVFRVDEGFPLPDWYDAADVERRVREALPEWVAAKIVLPGQTRETVSDGEIVLAVYGKVERVYGSGRVERVCGSGSVDEVYGSGRVGWVYGSGSVDEVYGSGSVDEARDYSLIQSYIPLKTKLVGPNAVLVDRSGPTPTLRRGRAPKKS